MSELEKIQTQVQKDLKEVGDQLKAYAEQTEKEIKRTGEMQAETRAKVDELLTKQGELQARLHEAEQKLLAVEQGHRKREENDAESAGQIVANKLREEGANSSFRGKTRVAMPRSAITSVSGTGKNLAAPDHRPGIQALPQRRMTIRDLLAPGTTDSNLVQFVQETGFTNNAAAVSENPSNGKPYSDIAMELKNAPVATIAHLFKASRQALDDLNGLASLIDARARYGLMLEEENQFLYGNGMGANIHGIIPQASPYAPPPTVSVTAEQAIDRIRLAILQVALAEFPASGIVLNPIDWALIELIKDGQERYIIGNPQAGTARTLWNLPVVETQAIQPNEFLVGAFNMGAQIYDRMDIEVLLSTENDKDFEKNMVTIRAEERVALAVYRPEAFVTGELLIASS